MWICDGPKRSLVWTSALSTSVQMKLGSFSGTASAYLGGAVFTDRASSSPGTLLVLWKPIWLCPKQTRGLWIHLWDAGRSLRVSATIMRTGTRVQVTRSVRAGQREKSLTFLSIPFLFRLHWNLCGELDLFAGWGIIRIFENHDFLYFLVIPSSKMFVKST